MRNNRQGDGAAIFAILTTTLAAYRRVTSPKVIGKGEIDSCLNGGYFFFLLELKRSISGLKSKAGSVPPNRTRRLGHAA